MKKKKGINSFGTARILNNSNTGKATNLERIVSNAPLSKGKSPAFDSPVSIRVHSYRVRLVDVDGVSAKYAIDGLVMGGVLRDDTTKEVREVVYSQTKVKNKSEEKTVITIERIRD
jgi:hypothetical protein